MWWSAKQLFTPHQSKISDNYQKALRFGDDALRQKLTQANEQAKRRQNINRLESLYVKASQAMQKATTEQDFREAGSIFAQIRGYKDAAQLEKACQERAEGVKKDRILEKARYDMRKDTVATCENAIYNLERIPGWKDADALRALCKKRVEEIRAADRKVNRLIIIAAALLLVIIFLILL